MRLLSVASFVVVLVVPAAGQQLVDDFDSGLTSGAADDRFGSSCAPISDLDGDGWDDFVVAAENARNSKGQVYLFSGKSRKIIGSVSGKSVGDRFGTCVAAAGDLNGDSIRDFLVGCRACDGTWTDLGAVYVYSGTTMSLIRSHAGEGPGADRFGEGLSSFGDLDLDGVDDY